MREALIAWLLRAGEPWTRYRTLVDLLGRPERDPEVQAARAEMLAHPQVRGLIAQAADWGKRSLTRHNDASHPIYALSTLADLGVRASDPGMAAWVEAVTAHRSAEGMFQSLLNIPKAFGGEGQDAWAWIACDAPTLLHALLAIGLGDNLAVQRAAECLAGLSTERGWLCAAAPELGGFHGPGRRSDPCPIANVYAIKALCMPGSGLSGYRDSPAVRRGAEVLMEHWAHRGEYKLYLFGIGTDFCKVKYPFVWYDILHVTEALSRVPSARADPRYRDMVAALAGQADERGRYTAASMYRAWKGWSFADKKVPSPWLTMLALRIQQRV